MDQTTAKTYDSDAHGFCERYEAADVAPLYEFLRRHVHTGMRVLEAGCGSRRDAAFMDSELGAEVTALDGSLSMVEQARVAHPEIADRIHHAVMPRGLFR
jgi:ubiquinone/menaquinone biosynthesis C-methylase UbiE